MVSAQEFQKIIHRYALHVGGPRFSLENFLQYLAKFVRRYVNEHPDLTALVGPESREAVDRMLAELQDLGTIQLVRLHGGG